jgi:hypothetical protein
MDGDAMLARSGRKRRHGHRRLGAPVARRVQAADPRIGITGHALGDSGRRQYRRMNLLFACNLSPLLPGGQFLRIFGQEQDTGTPKAGIDAGVALHVLPQVQRLASKGDFGARAALLAAPAPIAARLLRANMPLLDQRDGVSLLRQMIGRRDADDATADDNDINLRRQAVIACYTAERRGHETLLTINLIEAGWLFMGCSSADQGRRAVRHRGS